ncbi:unnamed protein product [Oreochromis niloticus]|nr:unnamed protein product [Mustela putorius furo]
MEEIKTLDIQRPSEHKRPRKTNRGAAASLSQKELRRVPDEGSLSSRGAEARGGCSDVPVSSAGSQLCQNQKNITAESGQNVTLTCRAPNIKIKLLKWTKAFLWSEHRIFYWNSDSDLFDHHPSFKNRVDLQDRQMKDGDVSLILKDVTINDAGTYKCHVLMEKPWQWSNISIIHLHVVPPAETHPHRHTAPPLTNSWITVTEKPTTTPPPTSAAHPGSTSITLPPPLSVLLPVGAVYVVVLLVLLVLLVRRCVHRKLEADGEDDITSSIAYSVVKSSNHQQPPVKETREGAMSQPPKCSCFAKVFSE